MNNNNYHFNSNVLNNVYSYLSVEEVKEYWRQSVLNENDVESTELSEDSFESINQLSSLKTK